MSWLVIVALCAVCSAIGWFMGWLVGIKLGHRIGQSSGRRAAAYWHSFDRYTDGGLAPDVTERLRFTRWKLR